MHSGQILRLKTLLGVLVLVGGLLLAATPASAATSKTVVEAPDSIKDATVNLYCTYRSGNKRASSSGSGVFISPRGIILTNAHVAQHFLLPYKEGTVRGSCQVRVGSPAKNQYTAEVLYISPNFLTESAGKPTGTGEYDFALLYVSGAKNNNMPAAFPYLPLELTDPLEEPEEVAVTGYSTDGLSYSSVNSRLKAITASSTITSARRFIPSNTVDVVTIANSPASAPGMSGGPVTNTEGEVAAIATAISTSKDPVLRAITLPYIARTLEAESGLPLLYFLLSDFANEGQKVKNGVASSTVKTITDSLFNKKK